MQEEIFGPVLSFDTSTDEDDAVRLASATIYGLAATLFTNDFARTARVVRRVKAGTIWTNS